MCSSKHHELGISKLILILLKAIFIRVLVNPPCMLRAMEMAFFFLICLYFDDIIYTSNSFEMMKAFKEPIMKTLEMTYMRPLHYLLD